MIQCQNSHYVGYAVWEMITSLTANLHDSWNMLSEWSSYDLQHIICALSELCVTVFCTEWHIILCQISIKIGAHIVQAQYIRWGFYMRHQSKLCWFKICSIGREETTLDRRATSGNWQTSVTLRVWMPCPRKGNYCELHRCGTSSGWPKQLA